MDFLVLLFLDTFGRGGGYFQGILSFLLFLDTFGLLYCYSFRAEHRRRETRREKFTSEQFTLLTIYLGHLTNSPVCRKCTKSEFQSAFLDVQTQNDKRYLVKSYILSVIYSCAHIQPSISVTMYNMQYKCMPVPHKTDSEQKRFKTIEQKKSPNSSMFFFKISLQILCAVLFKAFRFCLEGNPCF